LLRLLFGCRRGTPFADDLPPCQRPFGAVDHPDETAASEERIPFFAVFGFGDGLRPQDLGVPGEPVFLVADAARLGAGGRRGRS
jgi:hypothetical protein